MLNRHVRTLTRLEGRFPYDLAVWVFFPATLLIFLGVIVTLAMGENANDIFDTVQGAISDAGGWFLITVVNLILVFCIFLTISRFGKVRIGGPDAVPEFSYRSWFAMLFSAGMGIGLLFYGVAEPMFHFIANPFVEGGTEEAARTAMTLTFLHWGLHPWGTYALVGLALAYAGFNKKLPLSIRSAFYPLLGEKIYGFWGNLIDVLATVATLFGVATSLGIGVQQINAGLGHLFGLPESSLVQTLLIAGITAIATWSVVKGLDGGIRRVSEVNIFLAIGLLVFVIVLGPTLFILNGLVQNTGRYLQDLLAMSTWSEAYTRGDWQNDWTVFYWAWWIAWSPFVGMFIARVSYGRTVREYMLSVLLVPTLVTFLWMTAFGNSAIFIELFGDGGVADAVQENLAVSLFVFLENFPLGAVMSFLAVVVIVSFFVTSSDSGSMVIDIITSGGNPDPPKPQRLFWAITEGVVAAVLLIGGGLTALQTAAVTTGLPFALVLLAMAYSVFVGLSQDAAKQPQPVKHQHPQSPKDLKS
ncbi:MAG: BCCT family transporter [Opitutales bacterium]